VAETNRIRLSLGLKPLSGTLAQSQSQPETSDIDDTVGPQLPTRKENGLGTAGAEAQQGVGAAGPGATAPGGGHAAPKPDEATGAREVLAISLDRYTRARPLWR
jgi:hypothetical protein